jgi:hypothetical protein
LRSSKLQERQVSNTTGITTNIVVIGAKRYHGRTRKKVKNKGKFRDKVKNKREYHQQLKVKKKYLSPVRMRRCYHELCNNKTEQLHRFAANVFLPKRSYFCHTICGRARTYLAMSIDSLGFEAYYKQLYPALEMTIMSSATERYFQQQD